MSQDAESPGAAFYQDGPRLKNQYDSDPLLKHFLHWRLPEDVIHEIEPGLHKFGERVVADIQHMAEQAEAQPPVHVPFDPWGRRIDRIDVSEAWERLHRVSAEEGIVAIGYERAHGSFSRIHQFAKLLLFHPSSAFYSCPLAMTDGAAKIIEMHGDEYLRAEPFRHLTSRNPQRFWTSGQWMTERTGGSDVSGTTTIARKDGDIYRLHGDKWFTSATTSQMTMALARIEGAPEGSKGLSLFYLELRNQQGELKSIRINRLKDKLGTRALPTAELTLHGVPARLIGAPGEGVKRITAQLSITRLYNSVCAVGTMARGLALARDYARKRKAFGRLLCEQPLHVATLADLHLEFEAAFQLTFHLVHLLGREEAGEATAEERACLRLLTPVVKLTTGKQSTRVIGEVLESFGGAGYIEDTGLPRLLRDAQVFSIWEGTTNVLSLDVLRALEKENSLSLVMNDLNTRLSFVKNEKLQGEVTRVRTASEGLGKWIGSVSKSGPEALQAGARTFALALGRIYVGGLMLEFADWCLQKNNRPAAHTVARRWCDRLASPRELPSGTERAASAGMIWG